MKYKIPKRIKDRIWEEAVKAMGTVQGRLGYIQGAEEMYILSQQALEEKDKRIKELEKSISDWKDFQETITQLQNSDVPK